MPRQNKFNRIVLLAVLLMAAAASAFAFKVWVAREDAIDEATRDISNFASIMAEQVSNAAEAIDASLETIVAQSDRSESFRTSAASREYYDALVDRLGKIPHADVITIADAQGVVITSTRGFQRHHVDLSDREHFRALSAPGAGGLFVSEPLINRVTNEWAIYFSRRIETPAGKFLGIAVIGVRPEAFVQTRHALAEIEGHSFSLFRSNGALIFRRPDKVATVGMMMPAGSEWYEAVRRGGGLYHSQGYFDNAPRFVAVRPIARFPFVVTVTMTDDAAFGIWRMRSLASLVVALLCIGAFGLLLRAITVQYSRLSLSRERLRLRELRLSEQSRDLSESNRRFDAALTHMSQGLAMFDDDGRLLVSNKHYAELYGLQPEALRPGMKSVEILQLRIEAGHFAQGSPEAYLGRTREQRLPERFDVLSDGRTLRVCTRRLPEGGWIATHEDVSAQLRSVNRISHMAMHDSLTGLANRACFLDRLRESNSLPDDWSITVLLIDLDAFKAVNDMFGHAVGDALLVQAGARLAGIAAPHLVARLGGDEFAILQALAGDGRRETDALAQRLMSEIARPYVIENHEISIGLSIGVDTVGARGFDAERMMRRADLALYAAKSAGRNRFVVFEQRMEREFEEAVALTLDFKADMEAERFEVYYQPIVSAATCEIVAMEALLRWRHPERGMISPAVFIPLAEREGFINRLGAWVLRRACADAAAWPDNVRVAVNVSVLQLEHAGFADLVRSVLDQTGVAAGRLEVEITESVMLQEEGRNRSALRQLQQMGVKIALDDFGSGYSSLGYLKKFAFDVIKIDKSFVDDVTSHEGCAALVAATTSLARGFGIVSTAEGVETREQFEALRAASVTQMQGYLFGRPKPASEWAPVLAARAALDPREEAAA